MATLPDSDSKLLLPPPVDLVHKCKESIGCLIGLEEFVLYFNKIGKYVQVAYYGVVILGPACVDLQIKVYNLRCNITRIFDKFTLTLNSFQTTAKEASVILQTSFQFLLGGLEDVTIEMLHSLKGMAKEMIKAAKELIAKIDEQEKETSAVLETLSQRRMETHKESYIHSDRSALGLRYILIIVRQATEFWKGIEMQYTALVDKMAHLIGLISQATSLQKEVKLKFWQSKGFAMETVRCHANWIALHDIYAEFMPVIKNTREEFYRYITENPTRDYALRQFPILATQCFQRY